MFTVRKFQPNDMFSVVKLASDNLTERYSPSLFNYFYETFSQGFWVAEKFRRIIGFIVGAKTMSDKGRILMLAVTKAYRRQGIGSTLLNNFLEEMSTQNIKKIELEVRTNNKPALKFYQKHGFEVEDVITQFYQNGEDAYIMKKNF